MGEAGKPSQVPVSSQVTKSPKTATDRKNKKSAVDNRYSVRLELEPNGESFTGELLVAIDNKDHRVFYDIASIKRTDGSVSRGAVDLTNHKPEVNNIGSNTSIVPQKTVLSRGKTKKLQMER